MSDAEGPAAAPPGWYDDGTGGQRWWDGAAWTSARTQTDVARPMFVDEVPAQQADHPLSTPTRSSPQGLWWIVGLGLAGVAVCAGLAAHSALSHAKPNPLEVAWNSQTVAEKLATCNALRSASDDMLGYAKSAGVTDAQIAFEAKKCGITLH